MNSEARGIVSVRAAPDAEGVYLNILSIAGDSDRLDRDVVDDRVRQATEAARATPLEPARLRAVRAMLKHGRYRASGRGKPAYEFLHQAAVGDRFPRIFDAVDLLNAVSLLRSLPMSLIDLDAADTSAFVLRRGREGESYVFNATGQSIDLRDLLLIATDPDDHPCANPVKDAQRTKLSPSSRRIAAIVYAPAPSLAQAAGAALEAAYREAWPGAEVTPGVFSPASE